jgi:hypothetical protein
MCVLRYPEVLAHYYSLVHLELPREFDPPVLTGLGGMAPPPVPAPPPPTPQSNAAAAAAAAANALAAAGLPRGLELGINGLAGLGVGMPGGGVPRSGPSPSRAASQTKKSKRMSKTERDVERELYEVLYPKEKKPGTPGPASAAGTSQHARRRDSVRSTPAPPGVPMPPGMPMFPGIVRNGPRP